ncbi:MAG: hypothetical protein ACK5GZ_15900 [Cyanobium sp.]|jgi:hypothetical protein
MTEPKPTPDWLHPFWEGLRPDPLPEPPEGLTDRDRALWEIGARAGIIQGRELERQDRERWGNG